jgi:hypothetical protein
MDYVAGGTLRPWVGKMRPEQFAGVMECALSALGHAARWSALHLDLKPENLLVGAHGQAVLTDFGIAHMIGGPRHTVTGTLMGTINYMAPEQGLHGKWDTRSDLYSMGVVLYEMLTGRVPFDADTPLAILMKHVSEPFPLPRSLNPLIPESLERVLFRALSKQPDDRFQLAREMGEGIQAALSEAGLPLPERISLPEAPAAPDPPVGVFSGAARARLSDSDFARQDTDRALAVRLSAGQVGLPAHSSARALQPAGPLQIEGRVDDRVGWQDAVPVRGLDRAVTLGLGAFVVVTLVGIGMGGAMENAGAFAASAWPVEIFLLTFFLSLLMEALALIWLFIPISLLLTTGVLLNYYVLTQRWWQWYWWPLLPVIILGEIGLALVWTRLSPRPRARQLGLAASVLSGALALLSFVNALLIAAR